LVKCDAVVIGSGFGGLTSAALLAQSGAKVVVLEQHYEVGGFVSMFRRGKFNFDVAIHLVSGCEPGGEVHALYEKLGLLDKIDFVEVSPMYELYLGDTLYTIPSSLDEMAKKLSDWFPQDSESINQTIDEMKIIGKAGLAFIGGENIDDPAVGQRFMEIAPLSFGDYLNNRFSHPHVRLILSSLHPYAGSNIDEVSAIFMMSMLMTYHPGAYYPRGGSQVLSDLLRDYIVDNGGQVLIKRKVEKITYDGTTVTGVLDHKGNEYQAPVVISNADLEKTITHLLDKEVFPESYQENIDKLKPSHSAVLIYAGLRDEDLVSKLPHETFLFPEGQIEKNQQYLYNPLDTESNPCILICSPSAIDSSLAPEGHSVVSFMALCNHETIEKIKQEKGKEFIIDHFLQLIEAKIPNLRKSLVLHELATPSTIEHYTLNQNGAVYGWAKRFDQAWLPDMGPKSPIDGLYLTGHWSPNTHGVYGACLSGRRVAEIIIGEKKTWNKS
jgi:prolycopene isomerase